MTDKRSRAAWIVHHGKTLVVALTRVLSDALILALWVFLLALLFLGTNWPRWAFYALLVLGIVGYVLITAEWVRPREK